MRFLLLLFLFILGACFGSFLCCQARRLHLKDAKSHQKLPSRSVCLHCHYQLKWYDNIPLISWFALKGKCRQCGHKIGLAEPLSEFLSALAFVLLGTTIDLAHVTAMDWGIFAAVFVLTLLLLYLAIYDGLYGQLPTLLLTFSIICAIIVLILKDWSFLSVSSFSLNLIYDPLLAVFILGGLYLLLYLVSRGKWVGDGDWLLGTAIALALGTPWLALLALFTANFLACLVMLPLMKRQKSHKIYFGPFLVAAFVLVYSLGTYILPNLA